MMDEGTTLAQLASEEVTERYFRPVEGRYLDQALDRAMFFLNQGLAERAAIMLEVLCRLEPHNPRVALSYVEALIENEQIDVAKRELNRASFVSLEDEVALFEAVVLIREQQPSRARLLLERVVSPQAQVSERIRQKAQTTLESL